MLAIALVHFYNMVKIEFICIDFRSNILPNIYKFEVDNYYSQSQK